MTNFGNKLKAARIAYFKGPGHYKQTFLTSISLAKYSLVASQARTKSCRVATRATISAILSQKFQLWRLFSCDFFTCRVASSRMATRVIFSSRWRRDKICFRCPKMPNSKKKFLDYLLKSRNADSFFFNPVTQTEIESEIMNTPLNKAHG